MIEEAQSLYQRGDYSGAFALYQKMLDEEPENHEVLFMMSLCRQRQQNLSAASELLAQALLYHPTQALYHYTLGGVRLRLGQVRAAQQAYNQAARLNPNYAEAHVGVGYVFLIQQDYPAAETALRAALRANPRVPNGHAHLGVALLEQQRIDEALQTLQEAADLYPNDDYIQTHLGRTFVAAGHFSFASQCFRNALANNPKQGPLWLWLGLSLYETGDDKEALDALRRSLEFGGETPEALYTLARIHGRQGDVPGSLNLLMRVLHLRPEDVAVRLDAARSCRRLQRFEEAQDVLKPCADDNTARKLLVRIALDLHRTAQARSHLAALELAGVNDDTVAQLQAETALLEGDWERAAQFLQAPLAAEQPSAAVLLLAAQGAFLRAEHDAAGALLERIDLEQAPGLADEVRDWKIRNRHAAGDSAGAWHLAREHANRRTGLIAVLDEPSPSGMESDQAAGWLDRDVVWSWPPRGVEDGQGDPILVYGWPGSGRENLMMALLGVPGVKVLRDNLSQQQARRETLSWPRGMPALSALSEAQLRLQRRHYWREVRRAVPRWEQMPLIDSLWFGAAALPTIYRLFPTARVVVVQRPENAIKLDWALSGYDDIAAMDQRWRSEEAQLQQAMADLPLQWIPVDYEAVIGGDGDSLLALTQLLPEADASALAQSVGQVSRWVDMASQLRDKDLALLKQLDT